MRISLDNHFVKTFLAAVLLCLLYFQIKVWQNFLLGIVLFFLFVVLIGNLWQNILSKIFGMRKRLWITRLYSWFSVFLILGLVSSIFVVFYRVTPFIFALVYVITAILTLILSVFIGGNRRFVPRLRNRIPRRKFTFLFQKSSILLFFYIILWFAGLILLSKSESFGVLISPWQTIHKYYIVVFFLLTFLLGLFLFSKHNVKLILLLIIFHSVLLHLYLPMSHAVPWGGDVWRHIGVENKLLNGEFYPPVILGPYAKWREVFGVDIPEALIIPNKYAYGHLWGTSVLLSKTLQIDIITLNKWLIPFLWPVFLPLFLFRIGGIIFNSWRRGLVLAAMVAISFPFQALGGFTLPVSLGYLTFFFILMFWLQYLRDGGAPQKRISFLFALLMFFGYTLHAVLIWFVIIVSFLVKKIDGIADYPLLSVRSSLFKKIIFTVVAFASIWLFPVIEILSRISYVIKDIDFIWRIKYLARQFSGWSFAGQIGARDILSGNIFFNHTPKIAFVPNFFIVWRWHVVAVLLFIYLLVLYGIWRVLKSTNLIWRVFCVLLLAVVGGYWTGWFVLGGDRLFIRRLDAAVAFVIIVFFLKGVFPFASKMWRKLKHAVRPLLIGALLVFSWFAATAYSSGPDSRAVSKSEYDAANFVWEHEIFKSDHYCVIADTWPVLVLEGLSGRNILGGGFPIGRQFSQYERVALFEQMKNNPRKSLLNLAHKQTRSNRCWAILPKSQISNEKKIILNRIFSSQNQMLGDMLVWRELSTTSTLFIES